MDRLLFILVGGGSARTPRMQRTHPRPPRAVDLLVLLAFGGCGSVESSRQADGGARDAGSDAATADAALQDGSALDASAGDASAADASSGDGGPDDGGSSDGGSDAGPTCAGFVSPELGGCWYAGAAGASCEEACVDHAGFDAVATAHEGVVVGFHFCAECPWDGSLMPAGYPECWTITNLLVGSTSDPVDGNAENWSCRQICSCRE